MIRSMEVFMDLTKEIQRGIYQGPPTLRALEDCLTLVLTLKHEQNPSDRNRTLHRLCLRLCFLISQHPACPVTRLEEVLRWNHALVRSLNRDRDLPPSQSEG